jgi:hypothetical protein
MDGELPPPMMARAQQQLLSGLQEGIDGVRNGARNRGMGACQGSSKTFEGFRV